MSDITLSPESQTLDRRSVLAGATALAVAAGLGATAAAAEPPPGDFDFWMGRWRGTHRQLKQRLAGSTEWITFESTCSARKILAGYGNIDENEIHKPAGTYAGVSLRTYDPATRLWSIWWLDSRNPGKLEPPVTGSFKNGIGTFLGDDDFEGKKIKVRFVWTVTDPEHPHWEQAFSTDGGQSWETNWIMDFTREA